MKVTVCFGTTRVIVPCGDGELPVRELVQKAITRYKKATGKPSDYWVTVHNVKTSEDGGILDPDDQVNDVADDREQIIAFFEEQGGPPALHNGGDGASASSVGTSSPDIFSTGEITVLPANGHDVLVTPSDLSTGSALTVRRGSEPALNNIGQEDSVIADYSNTGTFPKKAKRWSNIGTPVHGGHFTSTPKREALSSDDENNKKIPLRVGGNGQDKNLLNRFARDSWRQSLSNQPNMFKWLEAQERQEDKYNQDPSERTEPVGGHATSISSDSDQSEDRTTIEQNGSLDGSILVVLPNKGGPLGIHVVPDFDENGTDMGLTVQSIEKGGRVFKDGRIQEQDRIVEINGTSLVNANFTKSQSIFKKAMQSTEIRLRIMKPEAPPLPKKPPPVLPHAKPVRKSTAPHRPSPLTVTNPLEPSSAMSSDTLSDTDTQKTNSSADTVNEKVNLNSNSGTDFTVNSSMDSGNSRTNNSNKSQTPPPVTPRKRGQNVTFSTTNSVSNGTSNIKTAQQKTNMPIKPGPPLKAGGVAALNGTRKVPPVPPARHPSTSLSPSSSITSTSSNKERGFTAPTNTRRIGKKINIQLKKGSLGLGFSITTRDNPAGGNCPIYIKNILPKGAAITDGRLKPGDRLLEVNGHPMTGKSQSEAVNILRATKQGTTVDLVVSRQPEVSEDMFKVPRELNDEIPSLPPQPSEKQAEETEDESPNLHPSRQTMELHIPLNDTGSAGLGVSVKGKTQTLGGNVKDLGIFIKAVIHGGAASKDGRLAIDDQLLDVNGKSLVGLLNVDAMETLRKAMQEEGPTPGYINIKVSRKIGALSPTALSEREHEAKIRTFSETSDVSNRSRIESHDDSTDSMDVSFMNSHNDTVQPGLREQEQRNNEQNNHINNNNNLLKPHNQLLDRLRNNAGGNRNDSYNRAVHESLNDSNLSRISSLDGSTYPEQKPHMSHRKLHHASPTVSAPQPNTVIIEQENPYAQVQKNFPNAKSSRPHSTIGIMRTNSYSSSSQSNDDGRPPSPPEWLMDWDKRRSEAKDDNNSPGMDPMKAFQREGFGRQSMSEKRKIKSSIDPRSSEYYQRAKQVQVDSHRGTSIPNPGPLTRAGSAESLLGRTNLSTVHDITSYNPAAIGPTLGMKKSTSLESLETAMQDVAVDNDESFWARNRQTRNRGCNDSFRAAVDRSYDPSKLQIQMDIVEEDSSEGGSIHPGRVNGSSRSSVNSDLQDDTLKRNKKKDKEKKGGILKGIFKFGRNRKTVENLHTSPVESRASSTTEWVKQASEQEERNPTLPPHEQARLEDQYRNIQERQRNLELESQARERQESYHHHRHPTQHQHLQQQHTQQRPIYGYHSSRDLHSDHDNHMPDFSLDRSLQDLPPESRAEKIQQLRSEHQRKHRERQGHYPHEDREEFYEKQLQQDERRVPITRRYGETKAPSNVLELPPRRRSEDQSEHVSSSRPSSRLGFSDNMSYSHYQNQDEIQEQMRRHNYYVDQYNRQQQRYHQPQSGHTRQPIGPPLSNRNDTYGQHGEPRRQQNSTGNVRAYTPIPQMYTQSHQNSYGQNSNSHQRSVSYDDYDDPRNAYRDPQNPYGYGQNRQMNPSSAKV